MNASDVAWEVSPINKGIPPYAVRLGELLRAVRHERGLTLHDVEAASRGEFKTSIVGAYERGERVISLFRLHRLAQLYNRTVDQVLPRDRSDMDVGEARDDADSDLLAGTKFTLDLLALRDRQFPEKPVIAPYVRRIQLQRQNVEDVVITLRDDDARLIAGMFSLSADQLRLRLRLYGIAR